MAYKKTTSVISFVTLLVLIVGMIAGSLIAYGKLSETVSQLELSYEVVEDDCKNNYKELDSLLDLQRIDTAVLYTKMNNVENIVNDISSDMKTLLNQNGE